MDIIIQVVEPSQMRPEVDGADWFWDAAGDLQVRVCPMSDWRYETLLGIHEAVEAILAKFNGVSQMAVDAFDIAYDLDHPNMPDLNAGDDPAAPYKREHCFATAVERILCAELKVDWRDYDDELATTYPGPSKRPTPAAPSSGTDVRPEGNSPSLMAQSQGEDC